MGASSHPEQHVEFAVQMCRRADVVHAFRELGHGV